MISSFLCICVSIFHASSLYVNWTNHPVPIELSIRWTSACLSSFHSPSLSVRALMHLLILHVIFLLNLMLMLIFFLLLILFFFVLFIAIFLLGKCSSSTHSLSEISSLLPAPRLHSPSFFPLSFLLFSSCSLLSLCIIMVMQLNGSMSGYPLTRHTLFHWKELIKIRKQSNFFAIFWRDENSFILRKLF